MTKAESYLHHIYVAAKVGDSAVSFYRMLLDNWFAYKTGGPFLTRGGAGTPHWFNKPNVSKHGRALRMMDFMSFDAWKIVEMLGVGGTLAVDHAVPICVLRDMLLEQAPAWTGPEEVGAFLARWYRVGVITQDQHVRLREAGLNQKMPDDWDGEDVFARYCSAGIKPYLN